MGKNPRQVSSGLAALDRLLGKLFIGDNVLWYDDAGSLAGVFCMNFIKECQHRKKPIVYVSFDRSPKNLLGTLGPLAESQYLTIFDCFTHGKGDGSEVFNKFYEKNGAQWPYKIIKLKEPQDPKQVMESIYSIHRTLSGDVRFVFESLTGMQDLWGGEDQILKFYTHSCPQLYELNTIAYWIVEKGAHSTRLRAHINQIAQVAIELSIKRGKSALTILKAEKRSPDTLNQANPYWTDGKTVTFEGAGRNRLKIDIGSRIKKIRKRQGLSQTEIARLVGVTPSTISQIENNQIYPSLTALFKIAETLGSTPGMLVEDIDKKTETMIFSPENATPLPFPDQPKGRLKGIRFTPVDFNSKTDASLICIEPNASLPTHFFHHKGEETGYLIEGELEMEISSKSYIVSAGEVVHLTQEIPSGWVNKTDKPARLLWLKVN